MSERVATSPAGDEVLIVNDATFGQLAGVPAGSRSWAQAMGHKAHAGRVGLLAALWYGGAVEDRKSGLATAKLDQLTKALVPDAPSASGIMQAPVVRACLEVEAKARRTHAIRLAVLPERWLPLIEAFSTQTAPPSVPNGAERGQEVEGNVEAEVSTPPPVAANAVPSAPLAPSTSVASAEGLTLEVADAVATALLARVVEVLSEAPGGARAASEASRLRSDLEGLSGRLAAQGDYVERLRRELRLANDRVGVLTSERDGLRQRLRDTEHNLKVATSADARAVIDAEVRRQVARIMEARPSSRTTAEDIEEDTRIPVNGRGR